MNAFVILFEGGEGGEATTNEPGTSFLTEGFPLSRQGGIAGEV